MQVYRLSCSNIPAVPFTEHEFVWDLSALVGTTATDIFKPNWVLKIWTRRLAGKKKLFSTIMSVAL